jgi:pilus assembly protein Flp/PilA
MNMDIFAKLVSFARSTKRFAADRSGATVIEYAMIASVVSIVIVVAVNAMGVSVHDMFQQVSDLMH